MKTILTEINGYGTFYRGQETLKKGYPWLTFGAILILERLLRHPFDVLELGSGGSTIFFSQRARSVVSLETDSLWYKRVKKRLKNRSNTTILYKPFPEAMEYIRSFPDNSFNMVLSDLGKTYAERLESTIVSVPKLKKGGWLIIDNYLCYPLSMFDYTGFDVYTFDNFQYSGKGTKICKKL
jgi:predicted O-methyltransferase YrrM